MARFEVGTEQQDGETLRVLRDTQTGASAHVWTDFGNNCVRAALVGPAGALVDALEPPASLDALRARPSWWGIPLLFPWPGRIPGGTYAFEGRSYRLGHLDAQGNAGHGFVKDRPWRVLREEPGAAHAALVCSFTSDDHPETLEGFPFPYRLTLTYRLDDSGLTQVAEVENAGGGPMPFGFGAHPYFPAPIAADGRRDACLVRVPAARRWDLRRLGELPESSPLAWDDVTTPLSPELDVRQPRPLSGNVFDGAYAEVDATGGRVECSVADPAAGLEVVMEASPNYPTLVVWSPPDRDAVCFEPWTCPPNAFNLAARGLRDSGVVVLQPGERWQGTMRLHVRTFAGR